MVDKRKNDGQVVALLCSILSVTQLVFCSPVFSQRTSHQDSNLDRSQQFIESKVLPLLRQHCYECHSHQAGKARGGLVLDSLSSILTGGDSGPAIEPGEPDKSLLIEAIRFESLEMPPEGKLDEESIRTLTEWVRQQTSDFQWKDNQLNAGAALNSNMPAELASGNAAEVRGSHWAFQQLKKPEVPAQTPSDAIAFLVERARQKAGVEAVDLADKRTLVLRLFSDLIGLPPSPEELDRLTSDDSPSLDSIVDELLSMPEFGERWARHWLDIARYADSNGCSIESNNTHDNAWRYRDYVIASFNTDKPYDDFIVQQLAGDLLDYVSDLERSENLIATGFLVIGPKAFGSGFDELLMDVIDEQIDTLGKATLGLSLGCARCHDHKFDPIATEDYYALAGIFASTQSVLRAKGWRQGKSWNRVELPVLSKEATKALQAAYKQTQEQADSGELISTAEKRLEEAVQRLEEARKENADSAALAEAEKDLVEAKRKLANAKNMKKVLPVISPVPVAMAVVDKPEAVDEAVRIRGEVDNKGEVVQRHVLPVLDAQHPAKFSIPAEQSGRLQLAQWLVDDQHGAGQLLARVAVNRIWGHLFAHPLVESVDNFGTTGAAPSHPELLDYLAYRFIQSNWSTKTLIREIVLSKVYQLSAEADSGNSSVDPGNQWLWRYEPKRIDAEVVRDSMLALSGKLDKTRGGKTLQHLGLVSLGGDHIQLDTPSPYHRRSIYIPIYRDTVGLTSDIDASMAMLKAFDFADPNLMTGARSSTVVPVQTLFLMNADFVFEQAQSLARRILDSAKSTDQRLERLTQLVYGRKPTSLEQDEFARFLTSFRDAAEAASADDEQSQRLADERHRLAWTALCQTVLGSNEFLFLD